MVDSIGTAQLAITPPPPVLSAPQSESTQPVLSAPAPAQPAVTDQVSLSPPAAAQQPTPPKVQIANPQVLGDTAVTMYMVNGQLYTRYRDETTNKVTYVPQEAEILSASGNTPPPSVNITA